MELILCQAVYQSLLHLTWIDKLIDNIRIIFTDLYGDQLKKPHTSLVECHFDDYFDQQVRELEGSAEKDGLKAPQIAIEDLTPPSSSDNGIDEFPPPLPGLAPSKYTATLSTNVWDTELCSLLDRTGKPQRASTTTSTDTTPIPTPDSSRPSTPASHILAGRTGPKGVSRRARKAASGVSNASSGDERKAKSKKDTTKKLRRWDADGMADEEDGTILDYSAQPNGESEDLSDIKSVAMEPVDMQSSGTRTGKGEFVLKDLDNEVHSILAGASQKTQPAVSKGGVVESGLGAISGLFRNFVGGKVLTKSDLEKSMKGMEEHLLNKNVAREAAVRLCEGIERELVGHKTGSFESSYSNINLLFLLEASTDHP